MSGVLWFLLGLMLALLALRLWAGPAREHPVGRKDGEPDADRPDNWSAEALARDGTESSVADLVAQGRAEELRGLGYRGDLREE